MKKEILTERNVLIAMDMLLKNNKFYKAIDIYCQ